MSKHFKKSLQWLLSHALTVFSCVAIIALGMAAIAYATTIGTNISTSGTLTVSSSANMATTTISGGNLIVDTNTLIVDKDNHRVGIGTTTPSSKLDIQGDVSVASVGNELSPDSTGAVCSANGDCVTKSVSVTSGVNYLVQWTQTYSVANNGAVTPYLGAVAGVAHMWGWASSGNIKNGQQIITANTTGTVNLIFTVTNYTSGTITLAGISLKALTSANPVARILNSDGSEGFPIRSGGSNLGNTFIGQNVGRFNISGDLGTAIGYSSLSSNTSGYYNTAYGSLSLRDNTSGYWNTAIGYAALMSNTSGYWNTAIGPKSLYLNTTGYFNVATGYNSLRSNTTGYWNTANGYGALYSNTTGSTNTALGYQAGDNITTGSNNLIIGYNIDAPSATADNQLNIGNAIYGNLSTGNVGIGTSTPNNKLDIYSTTKSAIGFSGASGDTYKWTMGMDKSNGGRFSIASSTALGTTDRFVIDGNGNVGIGTTSPLSKLAVSGGASIGADYNIAAPTNGMIIQGNVGIGTTTPGNLLDVYSTATSTIRIDSSSTTKGGCLKIKDSDGSGYSYCTINNGVWSCGTVSCE